MFLLVVMAAEMVTIVDASLTAVVRNSTHLLNVPLDQRFAQEGGLSVSIIRSSLEADSC